MIHVQDAVVKRYPLDQNQNYIPDLTALEDAIGEKTKVLIVNSPSNPTGAVYDRTILTQLLEIAARHDLWVISDECYDEMVFDGGHTSIATCGDPSRVITVFSFSKTYAMTGWRIGYVAAQPQLAEVITKMQEPVTASASALSQKGAEAALAGPQDIVGEMRESYRRRRDQAVAFLTEGEVRFIKPAGAFYLMIDVGRVEPSLDFAVRLLEEEGVATVPGSAFGPGGEGFVRVSLSASDEDLLEGLPRLVQTVLTQRSAIDLPRGA
jgi:aspartate aminotransferase